MNLPPVSLLNPAFPLLRVALASVFCIFTATAEPSATPKLTLDLTKPGVAVSPTLYGLMTEEINHSYDGGLYAELIQNRTFKDDVKNPAHWSVVLDGGAAGSIALDETQPVNEALTTCLKLEATQGGTRVGIANDGFWGIPVKPGTAYRASFYAKAASGASGPLTVSIESKDGSQVFAQAEVTGITGQWQHYAVTLQTPADAQPSATNRFVISTKSPGTFWFNLVSLFPPTWHDRPNGNRPDIMQLLADMKPSFLRLPGGNYLEGDTIATRFEWKKTLGDLNQRAGHPGCWRYRSSDGLGLLEFLEWCEDLQIQPVLAVYAGYSLKGEHVQPGSALQPFVDDTIQEIEYVTGGPDTEWGARRVKDGHPQPFPLTYVEIGNEDWIDKSHTYDARFAQFYAAIKAKYPHLQLIATAKIKGCVPDLIDDHFYREPWSMEDDATHYDEYSRTDPKIFVGEWATRSGAWNKANGQPTPNLGEALSDAAWLTGLERNSDVVVLQCYAPLFANVNPGARQWEPNLIGYDALTSYGSPSYQAQKMFSTHLGDRVVPILAENIPTQPWPQPVPKNQTTPPPPKQVPMLFSVATRDSKTGTIFLKMVNTGSTPQTVQIDLPGAGNIVPEGQSIVLTSANPKDTNTIAEPHKIEPVTVKITGLSGSFAHTFPPYSVNVLQIETH